jgi:hypothetical protein
VSAQEAEQLRQAKALIKDPAHWTQLGNYAVGPDGNWRTPSDDDACRWCAYGSVARVTGVATRRVEMAAASTFLARAAGELDVVQINDYGTHADVMALFDRAIELAEGES